MTATVQDDEAYNPVYSQKEQADYPYYSNSYGQHNEAESSHSESTLDSHRYSSNAIYPSYQDNGAYAYHEPALYEDNGNTSYSVQPQWQEARETSAPRKRREKRRPKPDHGPPPPYIPEEPLIPIPTSPSQQYFELSEQRSLSITDPSSSRKLLILDLNGTLLYRETYKPRDYGTPYKSRIARPRTYMPSFRRYLFHPDTRLWLDTMVWSSAKPNNVDGMVVEAFGDDRGGLVTVWARDTLGLNVQEYYGNPQTTKDLARPWGKIGITNKPPEASESTPSLDEEDRTQITDPVEVTTGEGPVSEGLACTAASIPLQVHSAMSTLLLDDSPSKARLQPWNHFCIPEYTEELRKRDVLTRQRQDSTAVADALDIVAQMNGLHHAEEIEARREKRKREEVASEEGHGYDRTLLAVIGVLDTLKTENNVAAWMRAGGLAGIVPTNLEGDEVVPLPNKRRKLGGTEANSFSSRSSDSSNSIPPENPASSGFEQLPPLSLPSQATCNRSSSPAEEPPASPQPVHSSPSPPAVTALPSPSVVDELDDLTPHQTWFSQPKLVDYWADRGTDALKVLGISPDPGV